MFFFGFFLAESPTKERKRQGNDNKEDKRRKEERPSTDTAVLGMLHSFSYAAIQCTVDLVKLY